MIKDGFEWCADVLDKFVTIEQAVEMGETVMRRYMPAQASQSRIVINIYSANDDVVNFITDAGVTQCGVLTLNLSDSKDEDDETRGTNERREIHTRMVFGGTEISASMLDVSSGQYVQLEVDFLTN